MGRREKIEQKLRDAMISPQCASVYPLHDTIRAPVVCTDLPIEYVMNPFEFTSKFVNTNHIYGKGSTSVVRAVRNVETGYVYAAKYYTRGCTCSDCGVLNSDSFCTDRYWHNRFLVTGYPDIVMPLKVSITVKYRTPVYVNLYEPGYMDLRTYIRSLENGASQEIIVQITRQLLAILQKLKSCNVSTGDFKLDNIILTSPPMDGNVTVRMCDMGNAYYTDSIQRIGAPERCASNSGYIATRWYRPIEVLLRHEYVDDSMVDMWGLGVVLWELVTGRPMVPGKDAIDVMRHMVFYLGMPPEHIILTSMKFNNSVHDNRANVPNSWFSPISDLLSMGTKKNLNLLGNPLWHAALPFPPPDSTPFRRVDDGWRFFYNGKAYLHRTKTRLGLHPTCPADCVDFLTKLLQYDPKTRLSIEDAIKHNFLKME